MTSRVLAALVVAVSSVALSVPLAGADELRPPPQLATSEVPADWPDPPQVSASSYLLVDASSGQVLAERDADLRVPVASTVKTLTALSALRRVHLDERVRVSSDLRMLPLDGAGVGIAPGDEWTVGQLLDALIARSGNDAAIVLADHVAGSLDAMLELMRSDLEALGVRGATVATVHGLGDHDRLSARDLATIARAAMADPRFAASAAKASVTLPGIGTVRSRNLLLDTYPGADGIKTGHTRAAGRCLIASATRDGRRLIAVVLGADDPDGHFRDATALLDHGASFVRTPVGERALEIRRPGTWVSYTTPPFDVLVPDLAGTVHDVDVPVEASAEPVTLRVSWSDSELAEASLEPVTAGPSPRGASSWLVDRAYAAMRAATAARRWPADAP